MVLAVTFAFGAIGCYDDYLKLVVGNSRGLAARWKYFWQSVAGLAAAAALYYTAKTPTETTLYLPIARLGERLGAFLLRRLAGESPSELAKMFRPELVIRPTDQLGG